MDYAILISTYTCSFRLFKILWQRWIFMAIVCASISLVFAVNHFLIIWATTALIVTSLEFVRFIGIGLYRLAKFICEGPNNK